MIAGGARLGIQWPVSCGYLTYCGRATCVLDPVPCERLDSRRDNSNAPGYREMSQGLHSSPADHTLEEKKFFCCVTTRGRKICVLNGLGRDLSWSSLLPLLLSMARSSRGVLAMDGLASRCLLTTDFPLTVRVVTVTLVPTRRQILTITPLAQASPQPRSTRSRREPALCFSVRGAYGSCNFQG
jgi:hypothetical protein